MWEWFQHISNDVFPLPRTLQWTRHKHARNHANHAGTTGWESQAVPVDLTSPICTGRHWLMPSSVKTWETAYSSLSTRPCRSYRAPHHIDLNHVRKCWSGKSRTLNNAGRQSLEAIAAKNRMYSDINAYIRLEFLYAFVSLYLAFCLWR
ncbi:hypothetical protein RRG08_052406 [Elysia crispata]|uniref:Uncharacterized protein n=1 Tax=Elysia crispata TaxID=231223 RepID=A0AAE1E866_9GAST|nr:hypothetical protein RRG08_052406 [Elysia crispata]